MKRHKAFLLIITCFIIPSAALALDTYDKLWLGLNVLRPLSDDGKWLYMVYSQLRFIDQSHPVQMYLIEGGVGRRFIPEASIWLGYRWSAHEPNNGFYQTNRLWQQLLLDVNQSDAVRMQVRSRLEEIDHSHQSQPSFRWRERLYAEFKQFYYSMMNPLVYDEVFFQLNKTNYTTHQFVSENRLFIGVNLWHEARAFWEVGYINQYEWSTPQNNQNSMSHILSINYNLV